MRDVKRDLVFVSVESLAKSRVSQLDARTHTHTADEWLARRSSHYVHNTHAHTQTQEKNIHALSGIRNLDLSNRVDVDVLHCTATVYPFLDAFAKMRQFTVSFVMSLCPTCSYSSSHWTDLHETW